MNSRGERRKGRRGAENYVKGADLISTASFPRPFGLLAVRLSFTSFSPAALLLQQHRAVIVVIRKNP